ncbi:unnamed protein product [Cylicocyclus nassatus]|uniref:Uncharacterized protein n=1 Tax=Cylicocyclus nassatus TaxID=53992 RepID=A0AA36HCQ3_CYLNA|nr:unnamed protein product [Cylicocyclus nassatus]
MSSVLAKDEKKSAYVDNHEKLSFKVYNYLHLTTFVLSHYVSPSVLLPVIFSLLPNYGFPRKCSFLRRITNLGIHGEALRNMTYT